MDLIGRRKEIQRLENAWATQDAFMMVNGRKYIGKSTLMHTFSQDKEALYFSAGNVSDNMNRIDFEKAFAEFCGVQVKIDGKASAWKDLLKLFADRPGTERKVLIIDNFHYLVRANAGILNVFKHAWETILKPNFVMVVLVVPNGRILLNMQEKSKSFMGRLTHRISLKPVTFVELMKDYPHHDFNQLMMLYAIVGGVPRYWEYFRDCVDTDEFLSAVGDFYLNPYGDLLDEPVKLIENEVYDSTEYHSILMAIAQGSRMIPEIAAVCGYKNSDVEDCVKNLMALRFVNKTTSIIEKRFTLSKPMEYRISDPMLSFWYTFVFPYYEQICGGEDQPALENLVANFFDFTESWFRQIAKEILLAACKQKTIPLNCDSVGTFFNKDMSVDIVGIDNTRKCLFIGDCKYGDETYTKGQYDAFVAKCETIKEFKAYKGYERIYGIFSSHPFDKDLMDYAMITKNVLLFNGITIYSLNS